MLYSFLGFNQEEVMKTDLDIVDLMILRYIITANGNPAMQHIVIDEVSYVWLSHSKFHEDLPAMRIKEGTLRNRLLSLKKDNWIMSTTKSYSTGVKTYYSITEKALSLKNDKPCHSEMTSDNKLIDNKNSNSTNVELEQPTVTPSHTTRKSLITSTETTSKKKSRYEQCADVIDEYTQDTGLKNVLLDYLSMRLAIKDKPMYVSGWKALLRKLFEMSEDISTLVKIVSQSLEHSWATFYPLKTYNKSKGQDQSVFSEYGIVQTRYSNEEVVNEQF